MDLQECVAHCLHPPQQLWLLERKCEQFLCHWTLPTTAHWATAQCYIFLLCQVLCVPTCHLDFKQIDHYELILTIYWLWYCKRRGNGIKKKIVLSIHRWGYHATEKIRINKDIIPESKINMQTSCRRVPSIVLNILIKVPFVLAVASRSPSIVSAMQEMCESWAGIVFVIFSPKCSTRTCHWCTPGHAKTEVLEWWERQQSPFGFDRVSIWYSSFKSVKL